MDDRRSEGGARVDGRLAARLQRDCWEVGGRLAGEYGEIACAPAVDGEKRQSVALVGQLELPPTSSRRGSCSGRVSIKRGCCCSRVRPLLWVPPSPNWRGSLRSLCNRCQRTWEGEARREKAGDGGRSLGKLSERQANAQHRYVIYTMHAPCHKRHTRSGRSGSRRRIDLSWCRSCGTLGGRSSCTRSRTTARRACRRRFPSRWRTSWTGWQT